MAFIDGAKNGFETAVRIIPYLVGILVAVKSAAYQQHLRCGDRWY